MDIRPLTESYAVSPQIDPDDVDAIRAAGYVTVINNRPDAENPPERQSAAVRAAVEAAGMTFVENPLSHGNLTEEIVTRQRDAIAEASGPVFAYCASGNRSSVLWALAQAGARPVDELIDLPARFGYQLGGLRPLLEARAAEKG
ncbi:MAG: TIGR01244 family phosphatase [Rhodobacteraceae bacterium]|nr:TIGR01244 family phosphatase [Paracoccaceae bacterium]